MISLGSLLFVLMGLTLGLIGAGGAILTIPLLLYVLKIPLFLATTYSLLIVGMTSLLGVLLRIKMIRFKQALLLSLPFVVGVYIARAFVIPHFPLEVGGLSRDAILKILLVTTMFLAAYFMIKKESIQAVRLQTHSLIKLIKIVGLGVCVGFMMGLLGAGGGFLIVPILVLFLGMEMQPAVGTSLLIITLNSAVGFFVDQQPLNDNSYPSLCLYIILSLCGMGIGSYLATKFAGEQLKSAFGWFVAGLAFIITLKELFF